MGRSAVALEGEKARTRILPGDRGNCAETWSEETFVNKTEGETGERVYQEPKTEAQVNSFFSFSSETASASRKGEVVTTLSLSRQKEIQG